MNSSVSPIVIPVVLGTNGNSFRMTVKYLPGTVKIHGVAKNMPGLAIAQNGDRAEFDFASSRDCTVNADEIVYGTGKPAITRVGTEIIGVVAADTVTGKWMITRWTHATDFDAALKLRLESKAKPAPSIPALAPVIPMEGARNQNRDRRQKSRVITAKAS